MTILDKFFSKDYFRFVELERVLNHFMMTVNHYARYVEGTLHSEKICCRAVFPFSRWASSGKKTSLPPVLEAIKERTCSRPSTLFFVRTERRESGREEESRASYDPARTGNSSPRPSSHKTDPQLPSLNRICIPRIALFSGCSTHLSAVVENVTRG